MLENAIGTAAAHYHTYSHADEVMPSLLEGRLNKNRAYIQLRWQQDYWAKSLTRYTYISSLCRHIPYTASPAQKALSVSYLIKVQPAQCF